MIANSCNSVTLFASFFYQYVGIKQSLFLISVLKRTVYSDTSSTFQKFLQRNRSVSIHHKNIQTLTTEVSELVNNICPPIVKTLFDFRENRYNIKKFQEMRQQNVRTIRYVSKQVFIALLNYGLLFLRI